MRKFLITDLHFGFKQNSITWLNSQVDFFYKQFIPMLSQNDVVYCLGDVFDVRSSINAMIASKVREIFTKIASICPCYIIGGNHDYFSPTNDDFCNIDMVLHSINDLHLVTHEVLELGNDILIPWYVQEEFGISELSKKYKDKTIFTHTDLTMSHPKLYNDVYSGHIHQPLLKGHVKNLGATFPMTFADADSERGFYILDENDLHFIPNKYCINFYRCYDESCFNEDWWNDKKVSDYIELYIKQEHMYDEYLTKINEKQKTYQHLSIIPITENNIYESADISFDIMSIVESNIPENLKGTFSNIKEKLKV